MGKARCWMAVAVALTTVVVGRVQADEVFANNLNWDFGNPRDRDRMKLNGSAQWVNELWGENPHWSLRLTGDFGQSASAFLTTPYNLSDYELGFTFCVRGVRPGEGLADGFTFVAQTGDNNDIGAAGGALGYARSDQFIVPSGDRGGGIPGYSYAVEFNTYGAQGLPGAAETVAVDILGLRTRFNQVPFRVSDSTGVGVTTSVKIRVKPEGLTLSVLNGFAGYQTVFQTPARMSGFFTPPRRLYLGFTAATGGLRQKVDILGLSLRSNQRM